jgi:hypothetical protein
MENNMTKNETLTTVIEEEKEITYLIDFKSVGFQPKWNASGYPVLRKKTK